jgi:hypothetical protein
MTIFQNGKHGKQKYLNFVMHLNIILNIDYEEDIYYWGDGAGHFI